MLDTDKENEPRDVLAQAYEASMQLMINKLLSNDYEFLGMLDVATGHLLVFGENKDVDGMARNDSYYDEEMPRVFRQLLPEEYFNEGVRIMARPHVVEELTHRPSFTCSFPARSFGRTKAGRKQWKFLYLDEEKTTILMTRTDITDFFTAERDPLSGLYNRQGFYRHAREALDADPGQKFLLVRCDIDRFKAYNDACGIEAGDRLLAEFGRAVGRGAWPDTVLFSRIEADHFCALFPRSDFNIKRWRRMQADWFRSVPQGYRLTSSVGVYEIADPKIDVSFMCDRALLALHTVKDSYAKKMAWYDDKLRRRLMDEQSLVDEMETALREKQFVLFFQPQINYASGLLVGAEALVRWQHPKRGLIPPNDFIPLFEKNGFILQLDTYVWEKSCQYLRTWLDDENEALHISISVNISRYDLYEPKLCERLTALVEKYKLLPSSLRLEITESAYMENAEQLIDVVKELRKRGFTVEMDDFGAGYSSLNILKDVPVDLLKLDIRFLSNGEENARGGLILSSVIHMAHWLELPVIAEGVETCGQADYLKSLNCLYMQGYHFGRPMPANEFEAFLRRGTAGSIENCAVMAQEGMDSLWNPTEQTALLFNRLAGAAAFLEYGNDNAEIIRANDKFYRELGTTREAYCSKRGTLLERFAGTHRSAYQAMLEQAVQTGGEAVCEVESLPHEEGGAPFWTRNRVQLLTRIAGRALLYLTVENITARK